MVSLKSMRMGFRSAVPGIALLLMVTVAGVGNAMAAPNSCPSNVPAGITYCQYYAASGSQTNTGASESSPFLLAPGMPIATSTSSGYGTCTTNCQSAPVAGHGYIFRGGDTWHFGNSSATPYAGGVWDIYAIAYNVGVDANCKYPNGTTTGCVYFGVDPTWYTGTSWQRPILTGDNAANTALVSSCTYQTTATLSSPTVPNSLVSLANDTILDSFELTGLCSSRSDGGNGNEDTYVVWNGSPSGDTVFENNLYLHGWTATTNAGHGNSSQPGTVIGGSPNGYNWMDHLVIDGSDSNPGSFQWGIFPGFYHLANSIIRYTNQGVGQACHDIHDNTFEYMYEHNVGAGAHANIFECNDDYGATGTANVFYNNIVRHVTATFVSDGQVGVWFCPNASPPEYWFNNIIYDFGATNNFWAYAGPSGYGCMNTGGQYMFNNTFVDGVQICHITNITDGGDYINVSNEHLISSPFFADNTTCVGGTSATNIAQTDAVATTQGYTTGSSFAWTPGFGQTGQSTSNTCANDPATPCKPASASDATVGAGTNHTAYCTALAAYPEYAIGTQAAKACQLGTTDACSYNSAAGVHAMVCPAQTPVARPTTGAWDSGAYQYASSSQSPPAGLTAVVH
jgi:hypothetical protein